MSATRLLHWHLTSRTTWASIHTPAVPRFSLIKPILPRLSESPSRGSRNTKNTLPALQKRRARGRIFLSRSRSGSLQNSTYFPTRAAGRVISHSRARAATPLFPYTHSISFVVALAALAGSLVVAPGWREPRQLLLLPAFSLQPTTEVRTPPAMTRTSCRRLRTTR